VAGIMLLALNLPLIRVWVKVLEVPRPLLYAGILVFATLGVYSLSASVVEVLVMYGIGVLGFFCAATTSRSRPSSWASSSAR
jgi:putative tricarboxylic transport membrane protein